MSAGLVFILCGLCISLIINVVYFSKKRIENYENKLYSYLLIVNLAGLIFELLCSIVCHIPNISTLVLDIIVKTYMIFLQGWLFLFLYYIVINTQKEYQAFRVKLKKITNTLFILIAAVIYILPIVHVRDGYDAYAIGIGVNFVYVLSGTLVMLMLGLSVCNLRRFNRKKLIPLIILLLFGSLATLIQLYNPELLMTTAAEAYVVLVMFFTIENPDIKLIEELNLAKEQAERANRAKTDFLSNMSHEIRTPLNAIVGFSQALAEEDISDEAKEEVKDIIMSSNNLLEIVNGILDISKIEANKLEIVNIEYDSGKLIREVVSLTKARLASRPLEFKIDIDPTIPQVLYGDYIRIKQIMINILTNAVKYTKEGYIALTINTVIQDDICRLIISVEDSGIGIKPEDIDKLFTKFQRLELEKNVTTEGTGLGLAITKSLVELMDGKIVVQSKYGEGSKFTIFIDQRIIPKTIEDIESASEVDLKPFNAYGQKVLVVDDNNVNLKVANRLLKDYNIDIELINSGQECLNRILDGEQYDLILMDIMMPRMKGTEVLKNLKNIIGFNTPVVALTADAISGMKERYISLGFDDYLAKPINKDHLCMVLRKYLKENNTLHITNKGSQFEQEEKNCRNREFLENSGVDVDHGLELLGDMEMYDMTIEEFYKEFNEKLAKIEMYRANNDLNNYAILVHAMKSDSKYLGFTKLAEIAYNHEMASKAGDAEFVNNNYDELKFEANRIYNIVREYIGD